MPCGGCAVWATGVGRSRAAGGVPDGLLGLRKSLCPPDKFSVLFKGTSVQGGLGQGWGILPRAPGEGAAGATALQGFHCSLGALAAPTVAQALGKNKNQGGEG